MSEVEVFVQQNILLIYGVFFAILFLVLVWELVKNRGKIKVRIKTPTGETVKWIKPEPEGNRLNIEKKPKWSPTFTNASIIWGKDKLGRTIRIIDIIYGSPKAIEYDFKGKTIEQPLLTRKDAYEINRLDAFKLRYGKMPKFPTPTIFWVLLLLNIGTLILMILNMQGVRIR